MKGFRVDTAALSEASTGYLAVSKSLSESCRRLRAAQEMLQTQTVTEDIAELLNSAMGLAEKAAKEARELGQMCEEVAEVYNKAERTTIALVDSLPYGTAAFTASLNTSKSAPAQSNDFASELKLISDKLRKRVNTHLRPVEPLLFCNNRLPCEGWLLTRALKAAAKKMEDKGRVV